MKRHWDGVTTTICLTVVAAVVLGIGLPRVVRPGLAYLGFPQQQAVQSEDARRLLQLPGRVAALLDVLEATPQAERSNVILAAQRPFASIRLLDAPVPNLSNRAEPQADLLRRQIETVLTPHVR